MKSSSRPVYPFENRELKDLPGEFWKSLPGFDGEYEISSLGGVKSLRLWRDTSKGGGYYTKEMAENSILASGKIKLQKILPIRSVSRLKEMGNLFPPALQGMSTMLLSNLLTWTIKRSLSLTGMATAKIWAIIIWN